MLGLRWHWLAALLLSCIALQEVLAAGFNYRYRDDEGRIHIGYSVPPKFIQNGYEVLNENGRVVDVVLPKDVLDERAAQLLQEAEQRHQLELQKSKDEALLRYYSSPEDVERVRKRKLQEFDTFIEIQRANIHTNRKRVAKLQARAAEIELNGKAVPEKILKTLATLEHKIKDGNQAIKLKQAEKKRVWLAFELDIERLHELLGEDEDVSAESGLSTEETDS